MARGSCQILIRILAAGLVIMFQMRRTARIGAALQRSVAEEVLLRQHGREIRLLGLSVMLQPEAQAKQLSLLDNE